MADARNLRSLLRLWDDPSERVRSAVLDELEAFGPALPALLETLDPPLPPETRAALDAALRRHRAGPEEPPVARGGPSADASRPEAARPAAVEARATVRQRAQRYEPGQVVRHRGSGYRGVVVHADPNCRASDAWYRSNRSHPPREQPWYYVLVAGTNQVTYAAQSSLLPDESDEDVCNQFVPVFFDGRDGPRYRRNDRPWPGWL